MHQKLFFGAELEGILRLQQGVVSAQQLELGGFSLRAMRRLREERVFFLSERGIYCRDPELSWEQRCWVGLLLGGPDAVISGLAAAHLDGWYKREPAQIDVYSSVLRRPQDPRLVLHRGSRLGRGEPTRTRPEVAIIDAAGGLGSDDLIGLVADAIYARRTTTTRLQAELANFPKAKNRTLLRELTGDVTLGVMSGLERRYLYDVERAHGLPRGKRQVRGKGGLVDVAYEVGLLVELDGQLGHTGRDVAKDRARDRRHLLAGRPTVRYGWPDIEGAPCQTAWQIGELLVRLGWTERPHHCRRCA